MEITTFERPKRRKSSAVSSGRRFFVEGTGNSAWARRYRDIVAAHVSDLGGADMLSAAEMSLIRRAATLELEAEQAEGRLSQGLDIDLDEYGRAAGHLRRILETLGIKRVPKPTKGWDEVIAEIHAKRPAAPDQPTAEDEP
jgi:hypothetical protein